MGVAKSRQDLAIGHTHAGSIVKWTKSLKVNHSKHQEEALLAPLLLPTSHTIHHQVLFLQPQYRYPSSHSQQLSPFYRNSLSFNPPESNLLLPISLHTEAGLSLMKHVPPSCLNPSVHYLRAENQVLPASTMPHKVWLLTHHLFSQCTCSFLSQGFNQATQLLWIPPSPSFFVVVVVVFAIVISRLF